MNFDLEYIYEHYVESSDGSSHEDENSDETAMMQAVFEDAEHEEEHVLNFKGSIKGHRVFNRNRSYDDYFILKKDAMGTTGFSGYQKCIAALRMLAYDTFADSRDECPRMSESTCGYVMVRFATVVVEVFGPQYPRELIVADTERLLAIS
nr:uncharacterized protein LOC109779775 [Aegilops tauschii subsp. strangulata]